jgi:hypothetical protein
VSQTVAAIAELGPAYTGLAIGYRVLNLDGTTYSAFSTTGVAETGIAGTYAKSGGAVFPDDGGRIVWGVSGTDYAEDTVDPAPPTAAQIDTQLSDTHGAGSWATATGFASPTDVSDAQTAILAAITALNDLSSSDILALSVEAGHSLQVVLRALYAAVRGKSITDDPDAPTYFEYLAPDNSTVRLRHDISEDGTTRSVTIG